MFSVPGFGISLSQGSERPHDLEVYDLGLCLQGGRVYRRIYYVLGKKGKVKSHNCKEADTAGAYPGLCSMKELRVLLLPWMGC